MPDKINTFSTLLFYDSHERAEQEVTRRGYRYDRHESWAFTSGIDFYDGPKPGMKASVRYYQTKGCWEVCFWE